MKPMPASLSVEALLARSDWVRALARTLLDDSSMADDVAQETMIRALQEPPHALGLQTWLRTVVKNLVRSQHRSRVRRERREHAAERPASAPSVDQVVEHEEARRRVVHAVLALEEPYRSTVLLRFWCDLEPIEIARQLALPASTIRNRLKRALAHLMLALQRTHGDEDECIITLSTAAASHSSWTTTTALPLGAMAMSLTSKLSVATALLVFTMLGVYLVLSSERGASLPRESSPTRIVAASNPAAPVAVANPTQGAVAREELGLAHDLPAHEPEKAPTSCALFGTVLDPAGAVVAEAHVAIAPTLSLFAWLTTDERGCFQSEFPKPGPVEVTVTAQGYPESIWHLELAAGQTKEATFRLEADATVIGAVRSARGQPVPDVEVIVYSGRPVQRSVCPTDMGGNYRVGVHAGAIELAAASPEWGTGRMQGTISPNSVLVWDVMLDLGRTICGRVVDETGRPMPRARVSNHETGAAPVLTDEQGTFSFGDLEAESCSLVVFIGNETVPRTTLRNVRPCSGEIEIRVAAASALLAGHVLRTDGSRWSNAVLGLVRLGCKGRSAFATDATGAFRIGPLAPGRYELEIGSGQQFIDVDLLAGGTRELGDILVSVPIELELARSPPDLQARLWRLTATGKRPASCAAAYPGAHAVEVRHKDASGGYDPWFAWTVLDVAGGAPMTVRVPSLSTVWRTLHFARPGSFELDDEAGRVLHEGYLMANERGEVTLQLGMSTGIYHLVYTDDQRVRTEVELRFDAAAPRETDVALNQPDR